MDPKRVFVIHSNECFLLKTQQTPSDAGMQCQRFASPSGFALIMRLNSNGLIPRFANKRDQSNGWLSKWLHAITFAIAVNKSNRHRS